VRRYFALGILCLIVFSGCCGNRRERSASGEMRHPPTTSLATLTTPLTASEGELTMMTWNLRGYPEKEPSSTSWLHQQITASGAQVVCVQEIANTKSVQLS
jgi:hypothetical protein